MPTCLVIKMTIEMKYLSFTAEEFCEETDFIQWVLAPTDESNQFWNSFLATYPNKTKEIQLAQDYIKTLRFQEIDPLEEDIAALKQRIWNDIEDIHPLSIARWWSRPVYWAAAGILLLVTFGVFWWDKQPILYETAYGQVQKIDLSDGSVVTLNAHSSLKVAHNLEDGMVREVWLEGEAYFDIAKHNGAKFIVHTPEADVEVLGTEFNVNTRRKETKVILHEGKVQLRATHSEPVIMKPGDMAIVAHQTQPIQLKVVQPKRYDYWRDSVILLNDKTVLEIVQMLEDNYGITIEFETSELLNKKLTGSLSLQSTDEFIENFATILDAEFKKTERGYLFK